MMRRYRLEAEIAQLKRKIKRFEEQNCVIGVDSHNEYLSLANRQLQALEAQRKYSYPERWGDKLYVKLNGSPFAPRRKNML